MTARSTLTHDFRRPSDNAHVGRADRQGVFAGGAGRQGKGRPRGPAVDAPDGGEHHLGQPRERRHGMAGLRVRGRRPSLLLRAGRRDRRRRQTPTGAVGSDVGQPKGPRDPRGVPAPTPEDRRGHGTQAPQAGLRSRLADIVEQVDDHLLYINKSRNDLRDLPEINPDEPTIVVAGYPNVGKSSFVNNITNARGETASYPFTTKGIGVGHFERDHLRYQIVDTPGCSTDRRRIATRSSHRRSAPSSTSPTACS